MPITASAKKEIRSSVRKRLYNVRRLRVVRSLMKQVLSLCQAGDEPKAKEQYRLAQKAIDKALKRGVIKSRTAARKKSMLVRKMRAMTAKES